MTSPPTPLHFATDDLFEPHEIHEESEAEWDAHFYHRVMGYQQLLQARALFDYLGPLGDGMCIDAGCGSGVVGAELLRLWPQSRLLAMDISENMLHLARAQIEPKFAGRAQFLQGDLQDLRIPDFANFIISNAVMHWVPDHIALFQNLYDTLMPGGVLATQFAYRGPFFERLYACLLRLLKSATFTKYLGDYNWSAQPVSPEREHSALSQAGFQNIQVIPYACLFHFESVDVHRLFMEKVVLRDVMRRLPTPQLKQKFVDEVLEFTDAEIGPCQQYYESLRCVATR